MIPASLASQLDSALSEVSRTQRHLVGVSGGRDSVALLHLLHGFGFKNLIVCHLDHGWRGEESKEDCRFVKSLANELGYNFESTRVSAQQRRDAKGKSMEAAAREWRLEFFAAVAKKWRCPRIFLGHNADDQVETFLFRLFRGSGANGLSAMRLQSQLATRSGTSGRKYVLTVRRPMLGVWRSDIDSLVSDNAWTYRDDITNDDRRFTRNRLRHEIIPFIEEAFGREIRVSLWRTADILTSESLWLDSLLPALTPESRKQDTLEVRMLCEQPVAKQRRLIHRWLVNQEVLDIGYREVELVRSMLPAKVDPEKKNGVHAARRSPAKVNLPKGKFARRRQGRIWVESP